MPKKIIIIDHDQDTVDILTYMLTDWGYTVTGFMTLDITRVLEIKPDLILIDTWLPGNFKGAFCKELKSDERTWNINIILLSTQNNLPEIAKECLADDYLAKPFDIDDINKIVSGLINGSHVAPI